MKKRIAVLGSTGSIGTQTLAIIREHPSEFEVVALAAKSNQDLLVRQVQEFNVAHFALYDCELPGSIGFGERAIRELAELPDVDIVVMAISGSIGLAPSIAALKAGKRLALASKEVLVMAGEIVMGLVGINGSDLTPIDSEHSAIFQCLQGVRNVQIKDLILTASGGPFVGRSRQELESVRLADALQHPTWKMGSKITIDSATLMNKALEWIEAKWLFGVRSDQLEAVIHRQSIVHSFVRTVDGSVLAQLGWPNMKLPILYSLTFPERVENSLPKWNPSDSANLTFEQVDHETFPSLQMSKRALEKGGAACAIFNAANERLVHHFLNEKVTFLDLFEGVSFVCDKLHSADISLEGLILADQEARRCADEWVELISRNGC